MPHDHKRASEISQLSESALAEIDALPDDDDERLQNLEATKPSKMVLDRFLVDSAAATDFSKKSLTVPPLDLSRPISIVVRPKSEGRVEQGGVSFRGDTLKSQDDEPKNILPSPRTESEYKGSQIGGSQIGGASEGRGTYGSLWRSGRFGGPGGMSYPRSPSEIEDEQATWGYFCSSLFCLVPTTINDNGSVSQRSGGGSRRSAL